MTTWELIQWGSVLVGMVALAGYSSYKAAEQEERDEKLGVKRSERAGTLL